MRSVYFLLFYEWDLTYLILTATQMRKITVVLAS